MRSLAFIEKVFIVLGCIGALLKFAQPGHNLEGAIFILVGFVPLAALYFGAGLWLFRERDSKANDPLVSAICGLAFSLAAIGIVTRLLYWPGAGTSLLFSIILLTGAVVISSQRRKAQTLEERHKYYKNIVQRSLIMLSFASILFALPQSTLINFEYRNDPVHAKLLVAYLADPENREKYEALAEYEMGDPGEHNMRPKKKNEPLKP